MLTTCDIGDCDPLLAEGTFNCKSSYVTLELVTNPTAGAWSSSRIEGPDYKELHQKAHTTAEQRV